MFEIIVPRTVLKGREDVIAMAKWLFELSGYTNDCDTISKHIAFLNEPNSVDAAGVEWDEKIHSANKSKTVDGLWRTRRNSKLPIDAEEESDEIEFPVTPSLFTEFMELVKTSGLPKIELLAILKDYGIDSVALVAENKDKIPAITFTINEFLGKR